MIGESILQLHVGNAVDESIKSYEYDECQPITGSWFNSAGQITITIENHDQFLQLHNSYLLIEGDVLKADSTRYANADLVALTNNGLMSLFSSMKLTLTGKMVEHVNDPGQAISLLGLTSYSPDYSKECGLLQGWTPDINASVANTGFAVRQRLLIQNTDPKGSFPYAIPMRDTLELIRKDDNDALFRTAGAGAGKVVLSKLAWVVPIV